MNIILQLHRESRARTALALIGVLLLTACASTPAPTASLQEAQRAIATADQAEAGRYAPVDLSDARTNLASAESAATDKKMIVAERLAQQSRVDAELATAKTADVKANAVNEQMKHSTAGAIGETQHSSGVPQ